MKPRINIYLQDHVAAQLNLLSKQPGHNKSRIVNDALDRFFNPEKDEKIERVLLRRLDHVSKQLAKIESNESITSETLALFVRYFLTVTPPLPQVEQVAAHAQGKERFEGFVANVGRRLAQGNNLIAEVLAQATESRPGLFTQTTDDLVDVTCTPKTGDPHTNSDDDPLPALMPVTLTDDDETYLEDSEIFEDEDDA